MGASPQWHYAALCLATAEGTELCQTRLANFFGAVGVGNCVSIPALIDWLRGAVREDLEAGELKLIQEGFSFEKGGVFLRVLLFSNLPDTSAIPVPLDCINGKEWPFLSCKADEWPGDPGAHRLRILVCVAGRSHTAGPGSAGIFSLKVGVFSFIAIAEWAPPTRQPPRRRRRGSALRWFIWFCLLWVLPPSCWSCCSWTGRTPV